MTNTKKNNPVVLGLDPGFGRLGYAVLGGSKNSPQIIKFGCIETSNKNLHSDRLLTIKQSLLVILKKYQPSSVAIEKLYFSRNVKTALQVAEARGVLLITTAEAGYRIQEFSPQEVKLAATGQGNADKLQVQKMLKLMFKLDKVPKPDDAADALALALCGLLYLPK